MSSALSILKHFYIAPMESLQLLSSTVVLNTMQASGLLDVSGSELCTGFCKMVGANSVRLSA